MNNLFRMTLVASLLLAAMVALLPTTPTVNAQGPVDQKLVDRLVAAGDNFAGTHSTQTNIDSQNLSVAFDISAMGLTLDQISGYEFVTVSTIYTDPETGQRDVQSTLTGFITETETENDEAPEGWTVNFVVQFRLVDNMLYMLVEDVQVDGVPDIATDFGEGWLLLEADVAGQGDNLEDQLEVVFDDSILEDYNFDTFSDFAEESPSNEQELGTTFGDVGFDQLIQLLSGTELSETTLPDGRDVEVITLYVGFVELLSISNDDEAGADSIIDFLLESISEEDLAMNFYLDSEARPAGYDFGFSLALETDELQRYFGESDDIATLESFGAVVTMSGDFGSSEYFSDFDVVVDPIAAPDAALPIN